MSTMQKNTKMPLRPINEWVRRALDHSSLSHAAIARELHKRGLIGTPDRSVPGKMAAERDVKAAEMMALAEITGYPPLKGNVYLSDKQAVLELLSNIVDLPATAHETAYGFLLGLVTQNAGSQQLGQPHDLSALASRRRAPTP